MMRCVKCKCNALQRMLHRANELGVEAIWMCMPCMEKEEPELAKNIKADMSDVEKDLQKICYPSNS